jgi:hypothetical protein
MLYNVDCSVLDFISSDISEEHDTPHRVQGATLSLRQRMGFVYIEGLTTV